MFPIHKFNQNFLEVTQKVIKVTSFIIKIAWFWNVSNSLPQLRHDLKIQENCGHQKISISVFFEIGSPFIFYLLKKREKNLVLLLSSYFVYTGQVWVIYKIADVTQVKTLKSTIYVGGHKFR